MVSINISPSSNPGALLINGEEIAIPGFISREEATQEFGKGDIKWGVF
jgi:hypothetical protein